MAAATSAGAAAASRRRCRRGRRRGVWWWAGGAGGVWEVCQGIGVVVGLVAAAVEAGVLEAEPGFQVAEVFVEFGRAVFGAGGGGTFGCGLGRGGGVFWVWSRAGTRAGVE